MRIALLGDTHGHLDPRIAEVVAGCELAVHSGDIGSGAVLDELARCAGEVIAVRGNNDTGAKWPAEEARRLARLPDSDTRELPGGRLAVIHGHQHSKAATRHAWLRKRYPDAAAVVYGHSHRLSRDCEALPWVLNPGAAGRSRTYGGPSCLLLTASRTGWHIEVQRFAPAKPRRRRRS